MSDLESCVDFLQRLIRTESLPGEEGDIAELVRAEMEGLGYSEAHLDDAGNGGCFLPDGYVDANEILAFLVENGVDDDGGLAGLPVADDQLSLTAADGNRGIYGPQAGLQRLRHRLPVDHPGGLALNRQGLARLDFTLAVERLSEGIDNPSQQLLAHRHLDDASGASDLVALHDRSRVAQDDSPYGLLRCRDGSLTCFLSVQAPWYGFQTAPPAMKNLLDGLNTQQFYMRSTDNGTTYVSTTQADIRKVNGTRVNVRGGPGTNFGVVGKLGKGDAVEVVEDNGAGWVRFRSVDGTASGWMADFLLNNG